MSGYSGYYTNSGYILTNYDVSGTDISTFLPTFRFTNSITYNSSYTTITFTEINNYPSAFIFTTSGTVGTSVYINTTTYRCGNWVNGNAGNIGYGNNVSTGSFLGYATSINWSSNTLTIVTSPVGGPDFSDMTAYSASIIILS
jgi:hypothetical protein